MPTTAHGPSPSRQCSRKESEPSCSTPRTPLRYHWSKVGTASQTAHAHLLLGRAHAVLGQGTLAMTFATSAFRAMTVADAAPWERALAHAVLAGAAAAAGDAQLHAEHYEHARIFTHALADAEDKEIVMATFRMVPVPGADPGDMA